MQELDFSGHQVGNDITDDDCCFVQEVWAPQISSSKQSSQNTPFDSLEPRLIKAEDGDKAKPNKQKYISEDLSDREIKELKDLNLTNDQLKEIKREINKNGQNPSTVLEDLINNNRVVGLSNDFMFTYMMRFVKDHTTQFRKAGATHLAIDLPVKYQEAIDEFWLQCASDERLNGNLDKTKFDVKPPVSRLVMTDDLVDLLKAAYRDGLEVVCVQPFHQKNVLDPILATVLIDKLLKSNKDAKVVCLLPEAILERQSTVRSLRDKGHSVVSVNSQIWLDDGQPLKELTADLKEPVAVATNKAPLSLVPKYSSTHFPNRESMYGQWDYHIVFPYSKRK